MLKLRQAYAYRMLPYRMLPERALLVSQEARRRMDICLELIGERNERIEELEDSVAEMKAIFRSQLSLAADQLAAARHGPS